MALPTSVEARLFYRCAILRYEDAEVLQRADHTTGAVYLAGYGIECILRALILQTVAPRKRNEIRYSFRGTRAHDYDWLRTVYLENGGSRFPPEVARHFALVNEWSTELRYIPRTLQEGDADGFLKAANAIIQWAKGRI